MNKNNENSHEYDFYILAMSFKNHICCFHPKRCPKHSHLSLIPHGLWPASSISKELNNQLQYCNEGKNSSSFDGTKIKTKANNGYNKRQIYQYNKHGSCSKFGNIHQYIQAEKSAINRKEVRNVEALISNALESSHTMELNKIIGITNDNNDKNKNSTAVITKSNCMLKEIYFCFDKKEDGTVGQLRSCPKFVSKRNYDHKCKSVFLDRYSNNDGLEKENDVDRSQASQASQASKALQCTALTEAMIKSLKYK